MAVPTKPESWAQSWQREPMSHFVMQTTTTPPKMPSIFFTNISPPVPIRHYFLDIAKIQSPEAEKTCGQTPITIGSEEFLTREYPVLLCSYWEGARVNFAVWNKVYHRRLLSNLPASDSVERVFWGDDLIMNLHLLQNCDSMLFIPEVLYCYRQFIGGTGNFSPRTFQDLNNIKAYQLRFLEDYPGGSKEKILDILFAEAAAWYYGLIQQALKHHSDAEVETMIVESLQLPSFVRTREYYLHESDCDWEAVELLRKADPKEYIAKAKVFRKVRTPKEILRDFILKIYSKI